MSAVILANGEGGVGMKDAIAALLKTRSPLDAVEAGVRVAERHQHLRLGLQVSRARQRLGDNRCGPLR